ncbi:VapE domain-containing protein [Limnohabitans sp. Bal53]|uniref:VapE domain-containing protein n=1 Tax=Limnohabitans sp. Bal53 TaxID=1977910 RepID=UPI001304C542|nr:VapE domain-containing protein [Limnohabitans sp. Bal53]
MTLEINTSSTSTAALEWYAKGYLTCPIVKGQKNPSTNITKWLASFSEQQIEQHWEDHPEDDVALYCSNGLVVLDADSPESQKAIEDLETKHQLYSNLKVQTKKGFHYYYRQDAGLKIKQAGHSTENNPERIDIRCGNSYIIAPPSTDKELMDAEIVPFDQLVELTQAFVDDLLMHNGTAPALKLKFLPTPGAKKNFLPTSKNEKLLAIRALIAPLDPDIGHDEWRNVLMAIHHATDGSEEGLAIADEWSSAGVKYEGTSKIAYRWNSFSLNSDAQITMGSIWHMLKERGLDANQILKKANLHTHTGDALGHSFVNDKGVVQALTSNGFPHQPIGRSIQLPATFDNFHHLAKAYGISIRYNEITKKTSIDIPHLKTSIDNADNVKRSHIRSLCSLNKYSSSVVNDFCEALADLNVYNPVRDWIASSPWDGIDRLEAFYATVVADDDFPEDFKKTLMKRWMIGAVAAVFMPSGFHCRGVLTFSGKQGLGKTSWLNSLVSDEKLRSEVVLTGHCLDASNKDSLSTAISNWLVEFGEVEATFRKPVSLLKSFVTNDKDIFRRPYASADSTYPRRTVFFASVNDTNFLNDITGNSRWWTIPIQSVNYQHGLDMQQVFAQFKEECYDKDVKWYLTNEEEAQLTILNKDAEVISPIRELTLAYLNRAEGEETNFLSATQFLRVLKIENPKMGQIKEVRVVLKERLGKDRKSNGVQGWEIPMIDF